MRVGKQARSKLSDCRVSCILGIGRRGILVGSLSRYFVLVV